MTVTVLVVMRAQMRRDLDQMPLDAASRPVVGGGLVEAEGGGVQRDEVYRALCEQFK